MSLGERSVLGGRYRMVSQIGRGGMGTVWHAHDELLDRDVAVKAMLFAPELTPAEYDVLHERTVREARLAARLSHPGIVTIHDIVEEDGRPWIVMELLNAHSLDEQVKQDGPLEAPRVAEIGLQLVEALIIAHEAGVLHRDIKPSNVLIGRTGSGRAVLTDFGIARGKSDSTITQAGGLIGSPAYIAPERARGHPATPAADLWSLGATLYGAVEGKSPFERAETVASLVAVQNDEPTPMERAGALRPVIEGLLRKDPADRLTAPEAAEALGRVVAGGSAGPLRPVAQAAKSTSADEKSRSVDVRKARSGRVSVPETAAAASPKAAERRRFELWQLLLVLLLLAIVADMIIFIAPR